MGAKKKLRQFAELNTFENVIQVGYHEIVSADKFRYSGRWAKDVFSNDRAISLELGCGKGEYSLGLARFFPERNFIGVDIKGARIWRGAKTAIEEKIDNVRFLRSRIDFIERIFDKNRLYNGFHYKIRPHFFYRIPVRFP